MVRVPIVETREAGAADEAVTVALVNRAVATRDHQAFGQLYGRFVERIYRYLYLRCGRQADAEDLTEQVFLNAWESIPRYRWQGRPFKAWLYRLAHNAHIDHTRKQHPTISLDDDAHPLQLESLAVGNALETFDDDHLAKAVRQLTSKQQQVIHMRFVVDLDTSEIARAMGEREGAIRALQMRGLLTLRRVLDKQQADAAERRF